MSNCTTLDHIYPGAALPVTPGTPCYCGAKTLGGVKRKAVKVGSRVRVLGAEAIVITKERGEDVFTLDQVVRGRRLFEGTELEVL